MLILLHKRHPTADRPIIDFDVALLLEPMTLWGTTAGVILNSILPSWLVNILIIATVTYAAINIFKKGITLLKKEQQSLKKKAPSDGGDGLDHHNLNLKYPLNSNSINSSAVLSPDSLTSSSDAINSNSINSSAAVPHVMLLTSSSRGHDHDPKNAINSNSMNSSAVPPYAKPLTSSSGGDDNPNDAINSISQNSSAGPFPELTAILRKERRTPLSKIALLSAISIAYMVGLLLAGGHGSPSVVGVSTCSLLYWLIIAIPLPVLYIVSLLIGRRIQALYERKVTLGYTFQREDPKFTERQIKLYPVYSISAGLVGGLLGMGGGIIKNPLMLHLGMNALVASSTSNYMILFTSFTSCFAFAIMGALSVPYALWYALMGFCGAIIGQVVVDFIVKKYKMQSLVVLILGTVMAVGGIMLVASSAYTMFNDVEHQREQLGFSLEMCEG